ncbi:MAG: lysozyme inhibitor LprI family protein [Novosphingobium sp.]
MLLAACNQSKPAEQVAAARQPAVPKTARAEFARCDERGAHAEIIACKEELATKAGAEVDRLYQQSREVAAKLDSEYRKAFPGWRVKVGDTFAELAVASQDGWKAYAEKQCQFQERTSFGGSGGGDFGAECRLRLNNQRAEELALALQLAARQLQP